MPNNHGIDLSALEPNHCVRATNVGGFPALLRECNMTLVVAVVLAFGAGFLIRPIADSDHRRDPYRDYRNLSRFDD
jgi:hypothetical protein